MVYHKRTKDFEVHNHGVILGLGLADVRSPRYDHVPCMLGWWMLGVGGREVPSGMHAADMAMLKCMLVWWVLVVGGGGWA